MNDKTKIIVAVACLAIAGVAVAWQLGVFSSGPKGATSTDVDDNIVQTEEMNGMEYNRTEGGMTSVNVGNGQVPIN